MPSQCSVSGCKSNYKTQSDNYSTFSLPKDGELKQRWLEKIPNDFTVFKNPRVCEKHFPAEDIIRIDKVLSNGEIKELPRIRPKLKENAVPTIFPDHPSYFSSNRSSVKRLPEVEIENFEKAIKESLLERKAYEEEVAITNLSDIQCHLEKKRKFPNKNCSYLVSEKDITIIFVSTKNTAPVIAHSIVIQDSLEFNIFNEKIEVKNKFNNKRKIRDTNMLDDIIDSVDQSETEIDSEVNILDVINYIKKSSLYNENDCMKFLTEQILLCHQTKNNRRYSNLTMLLASSLFIYSPSGYSALEKLNYLCLPHPRNLRKMMACMKLDNFDLLNSVTYLKTRMKYLKKHEKVVSLILDEIYIESRLHFKGGSIYGLSENDDSVAKTAQVFMVSSVFSNYKDVVCIVPVNNMGSEFLKKEILLIITELEKIGLEVLSLVSDNNIVNRKAFSLLSSDNSLQPVIQHPNDPTRKLFMIFDTVHIMKCVRNNWFRKSNNKVFTYPLFDDPLKLTQANFNHLEMLYELEKTTIVKYAHSLSNKVLYPSNIDKQSVNLTLKLINENNSIALKHISCDYPDVFGEVEGTCEFLKIFSTFWKIVNVKSALEEKRFNDVYRAAVTSKNCLPMQFLSQFSDWLKKWKELVPVKEALTSQTFQSIMTTVDSFLSLVDYVFVKYQINYLLLSKFQSDDLESRFGSYRQMSGSNYYISFADLIASERKLRFKDLVLLSSSNINVELKSLLPLEDHINSDICLNTNFLSEFLNVSEFEPAAIPSNIQKILIYIGGYNVKKELNLKSCSKCVEWLLLKRTSIDIDDPFSFTLDIDRGKLKIPTDTVMEGVFAVWQISNALLSNNSIEIFLKMKNQLAMFYKLSCIFFENHTSISEEICECGFNIKTKCEKIILRTCKIFLNNIIKAKNDKIILSKQNQNSKIKKFNS